MKFFKTEHKKTGKIEIYNQITVNMNDDLRVIEEVSKEENDKNTMKVADKNELREARKARQIRKSKGNTSTSESVSKKVVKRLGYGEDERGGRVFVNNA